MSRPRVPARGRADSDRERREYRAASAHAASYRDRTPPGQPAAASREMPAEIT